MGGDAGALWHFCARLRCPPGAASGRGWYAPRVSSDPTTLPAADDAPSSHLAPTAFVDSDHPDVVALARRSCVTTDDAPARAAALFLAVRDGLRYDPYAFTLDPEAYRASAVARRASGFCVPKAILLAALCRAQAIPARLGFADVRNHLQSAKLRALMGTDVFVFHGYAELWLDGRWLKATPAFDAALCARFGVAPLVFDGRSDALFHEYDAGGRRYMEYVRYRGTFGDLPFEAMVEAFRSTYGALPEVDMAGRDEMFHGPR